VVSPATFNTIAKLASGVNDSLALNVVHDAIGAGQPVLVQPHVSTTLHAHPLLRRNLMVLTELGVHVVEEPACEGGCPAGHHDSALDAALA
jgi:phosphopantothenoylcysteine synthetase/decarboxylase